MASFNISNQTATESTKLTWTISDIAKVRTEKELFSQQTITLDLGEKVGAPSKWQFKLAPKQSGEQNFLGLYLSLVKCPNNVVTIPVTCEFTIPSKKSTDRQQHFFSNKFDKEFTLKHPKKDWGFVSVIPQEGPLPPNMQLTDSGALEINIGLVIKKPPEEPSVALQNYVNSFETVSKAKLSADMSNMYTKHLEGSSHATTVCSKDDMKFTVNPGVLAARSPEFQTIFEKNENPNGVLEITDISGNSLDSLFYFMYTGTLKPNWKDVGIIEELVYGAHKYKQTDLLNFFDQVLNLVCTRENCGKLVSVAKLADLKTAEKELLEFFKKGTKEIEEMVQFAKDAEFKWKIEEKQLGHGEIEDVLDDFVSVD